jgi:hypothetical protein
MKVVAAYLLAQLGGNAAPSAGDITKILSAGAWGGGTRMMQGDWAARVARRRAHGGVPPCAIITSAPRREQRRVRPARRR